VSLPIITRAVSRDGYGAWALTTVYATLTTSATALGLPVVFERNFFECRDDRERHALLYSVVAYVALTYVVVGLITALWSRPLAAWLTGSPSYGPLLIISFIGASLLGVKSYYLTFFRNTGAARDFVRYSIDENVTGVVFTIVMVTVLHLGVIALALGPCLASGWVLATVGWRTWRKSPPVFSATQLKSALGLALPLTPRIFLKAIAGIFDKYLVAQLSSVGGAGVYALGQRLAYSVFTLMTAFENVFAPQVYQRMFRSGPEAGASIGQYLTPFIYASVAAALMVATFSIEIVTTLAAPGYRQAVPVASLLAFYYAVLFFGKLPQLVYAKRVSLMLFVSTFSVAVNVGLCGWFAAKWGAVGAAGGTVLGGLLSTGIYMILGQRHFAIKWAYGELALMYGFLAAAVVLGGALTLGPMPYGAGLALRLAIVAGYAWLGLKFGIITKANISAVVGTIRQRIGMRESYASR
jgi:O-antigen/teichoic acid export membrane protein